MRNPVGTGWLAREQAAKAALAAREGGYNLTQTEKEKARSAMLQAQADAALAHKEAQDRLHRETVTTCPCCQGKGRLTIIEAAAALEAVESYQRVGWHPNATSIGRVSQGAYTVDRDGQRVSETAAAATETVQAQVATKAANPVPMAGANDETDAGSDEEAIAALDKPRRRR